MNRNTMLVGLLAIAGVASVAFVAVGMIQKRGADEAIEHSIEKEKEVLGEEFPGLEEEEPYMIKKGIQTEEDVPFNPYGAKRKGGGQ